ncbi:DJ-1/PfpI family protein [Pedobacter sp. UBA5917]|jgi:transcriptional regulator GlxA family with amidase domain|uniref:DJ-1/PfpI family protein n=1 Tax=Pedobacter sp. UBA5917 TaxID=1947061 RepID=UPI0025F9A29F|nr:DJ-1/PfpI family protein [Pedobacter sp. UBA5917]
MTSKKKINVAVLIYPGVELIDMNGPLDVFVKTNRFNGNKYRVFTLAETTRAIRSESDTVKITPDYNFKNCPQPDIIVIPGQIIPGNGPLTFGSGSNKLLKWITQQAQHPGITIMSVCVGLYILAKTGLLTGKKATTHWEAIRGMEKQYPNITFIENQRYVADANFVTTGGVTSGIDGALYLIEKLDGAATALQVADTIVYNREAPLPPDTILH